jgi:uncharacterized membrane protein YhaH (DUF805 family)
MNGAQIWASIKRGFGGVFRFGGRDTRGDYWPYAIIILLLNFLASMAVTATTMVGAMVGAFQSVQTADGSSTNQAAIESQMMEAMMGDMQQMVLISTGIGLIGSLLLLAATARRLHDRGWSGWWLALPLAGQLFGGYFGVVQVREMSAITDFSDPAALSAMQAGTNVMGTIIGLVTWAFYIVLLIQLVQDGSPEDNRFGPSARSADWPD